MLTTGKSASDIAKEVGCSTNLVYVVKSNRKAGATKPTQRRGPGRQPKAAVGAGGLDGILAAVKNSERDREAMRAALQRIQSVIAAALA